MNRNFSAMNPLFKTLISIIGAISLTLSALASTTLPDSQVGVEYSRTVGAPEGTVFSATGLPEGISINQSSGTLSGTPTTPGSYLGTISLTEGGLSNVFEYILEVTPANGTLSVTNPSEDLYSEVFVGQVFGPLEITTGDGENPFSMNIGGLPQGISFDPASNSILTRPTDTPPTAAGEYIIPLSVNNEFGTGPESLLTIKVLPNGDVPVISSSSFEIAPLGRSYSYLVIVDSIYGPITNYTATGLPFGLSLNQATGGISGVPTAPGVAKVFLNAENEYGISDDFLLTLIVGDLSIIDGQTEFETSVGSNFSAQLNATPIALSFNANGLPETFSFDGSNGTVTGTPSEEGVIIFFISANNEAGEGPEAAITINVGASSAGGAGNSHMAIVKVREYPQRGGKVTGSRSAPIGEMITLLARENPGYEFSHWVGGLGLNSERMIDRSITFVLKENITLTAVFNPIVENKGKQKK